MTNDPPLLECRQVSVTFGGVRAVSSVDLTLDTGQILGLIGPNGAGKTTLVNAITGAVRMKGSVLANGAPIDKVGTAARSRAGIGRTFQAARLFADLTVLENTEIGPLRSGMSRKDAKAVAMETLSWIGAERLSGHPAGSLPYGEQRRVAIARALAARPKALLLDEPAAGMTEDETDELSALIHRIRDEFECGIVVIEHDMRLIMNACDRVHVLVGGATLLEAEPERVRHDPRVIEAYLGAREIES